MINRITVRTFRRNVPGYLQQMSMAMQVPMTYRVNWALHFVSVLLQIYILRLVWTAVYAGRSDVDGVGLPQLVAYLTLANLQLSLLWPFIAGYLQDRVREGKIAIDLARPIGLIDLLLAYQLGVSVGTIPFVVLALAPALLLGGVLPPASAVAGLEYLVSLLLAYAIVVLLGLLVGLTSFWTLENGGIFTIYLFVNQFFAGTMVPLSFFPPFLRTVASFLPFQAQAFVPVSIYLGQIQGSDLASALATQLFWVVALVVLARLAWSRAMHRVVIQGG